MEQKEFGLFVLVTVGLIFGLGGYMHYQNEKIVQDMSKEFSEKFRGEDKQATVLGKEEKDAGVDIAVSTSPMFISGMTIPMTTTSSVSGGGKAYYLKVDVEGNEQTVKVGKERYDSMEIGETLTVVVGDNIIWAR
ncbi:hypothetical protein [Bacillus cereus]|uniref:hypothetical protein n=1 Tax=Bacillus cereus TaxID=1396 RepID=UPI000BFCE2CE|nr:hypothetical protein [Bacillus cereus]PGR83499.1 hypothetical protein COC63_05805 [Bacillus cereus]